MLNPRFARVTILAAVILLSLVISACGGKDDAKGPGSLVPQRATLVGDINVEVLLSNENADVAEFFGPVSGTAFGGPIGVDEFFSLDQVETGILFRDVKHISMFGESDDGRDSEYFGALIRGKFDEMVVVAELESVSGQSLAKATYKEQTVYRSTSEDEVVSFAVLDSGTFAVGTGGALEDIIDLREGEGVFASGKLIDAFYARPDAAFRFGLKVPRNSVEAGDSSALPLLNNLPFSLDFLSALDILVVAGELSDRTMELSVALDFDEEEAAKAMVDFIQGLVSLAAGFGADPETADLLSGLETEQDGARLTIKLEIPTDVLPGLLEDAATVAGESTPSLTPPVTPEIRLLETAIGNEVPLMASAAHVSEGENVDYSTTPPTSGMHWGRWADCGWYPDGLEDEVITHNLEHGNIVVSYNFANPAQVTELRDALSTVPQFENWGVARAYDKIPEGQIALTAWGFMDSMEGVSPADIALFFEAFAGFKGPERVAC